MRRQKTLSEIMLHCTYFCIHLQCLRVSSPIFPHPRAGKEDLEITTINSIISINICHKMSSDSSQVGLSSHSFSAICQCSISQNQISRFIIYRKIRVSPHRQLRVLRSNLLGPLHGKSKTALNHYSQWYPKAAGAHLAAETNKRNKSSCHQASSPHPAYPIVLA